MTICWNIIEFDGDVLSRDPKSLQVIGVSPTVNTVFHRYPFGRGTQKIDQNSKISPSIVWLWHSQLAIENPPIFKNGKPFISIRAIYTMAMLNNQRVNQEFHSER